MHIRFWHIADVKLAVRQSHSASSGGRQPSAHLARRATLPHPPPIAENQKNPYSLDHPASARGTLRPIVTKREAGCDGCDRRATTRRARSVRRSRVVPTPRRWCQAAGQAPGATVTRTPGTPRRARYKSSNIARGMPDVFGCTCDRSCAFSSLPLHTRPRVQRRPAFPAPSGF